MLKLCPHCKTEKPLAEFRKSSKTASGHTTPCVLCSREKALRWYYDNKEKSFSNTKRYREINPKLNRESSERWYNKNKARTYQNNLRWNRANPDKARGYSLKRRSNIKGALSLSISALIRQSLRTGKGGRHWEDIVGYTTKQLKSHLEKQFVEGMSWENRKDWHIDHKIPISVFNYTTYNDFDFKRCWSLSNLRPLWKRENLIKYNKIAEPFQPSLAMGG